VFWAGDIGLAEAYIDGDWWTPDLVSVLDFGLRNEASLPRAASSPLVQRCINKVRHAMRRNTRRGSKRNIQAHYDLGNAFYAPWLDATMNYSSALYRSPDQTLEDAQNAKLDRVIDLLAPNSGDDVLEIGCGWGAVAERLAGQCRFTGITLSREQLAYAKARVRANADIRLQDYRDIKGKFDRIVSIEMFEAVGEAYWGGYFEKLRNALRPGGRAVLQVITIDERRFSSYRSAPDFIQKYIFPGGMLPTVPIMQQLIDECGMKLERIELFGASYAATLAEWQRRFQAAWPSLQELGFDRRFKRMWEFYLAYCQSGFANNAIDVGLYLIKR
jgi:cyclopropane-fatty-acyl-phospholipid synthase